MSTAVAQIQADDRIMEYTPFGESRPIKLSLAIVRKNIAVPTRSGAQPSDGELMRFMMLCQARELNPWVGDAYLVGYDSKDGAKFSLITAIQALLKRAEANPNFDGMESGVVVSNKAGELIEREGDMTLPGETLLGSWARLWRKDRAHSFYDSLKLSVYDTGRSQWAKDPAGMIVKCAEASVLRKAFPSQLGALYIEQERGAIERGNAEYVAPTSARVTKIPGLEVKPAAEQTQQVSEPEPEPEEPAGEILSDLADDAARQERLDIVQGEIEQCTTAAEVDAIQSREFADTRWSNLNRDMLKLWCDNQRGAMRKKGGKQGQLV